MKCRTRFLVVILSILCSSAFARQIQFASSVSNDQIQTLVGDFNLNLNITDDTNKLQKLMGLQNNDNNSLMTWLTERVGYVVGQSEDPKRQVAVLKDQYTYQN